MSSTRRKEKISNFIRETLPRKDKGNHEEYSRTMLTLFKSWTDPLSLNLLDQTWIHAFSKHNFSDRHQQIMGRFHVRYECNNTRDNFRLQHVHEAKKNGFHWVGGQFIHVLDREGWAAEKLDSIEDNIVRMNHAFNPME